MSVKLRELSNAKYKFELIDGVFIPKFKKFIFGKTILNKPFKYEKEKQTQIIYGILLF